jgi:hypothetical protein
MPTSTRIYLYIYQNISLHLPRYIPTSTRIYPYIYLVHQFASRYRYVPVHILECSSLHSYMYQYRTYPSLCLLVNIIRCSSILPDMQSWANYFPKLLRLFWFVERCGNKRWKLSIGNKSNLKSDLIFLAINKRWKLYVAVETSLSKLTHEQKHDRTHGHNPDIEVDMDMSRTRNRKGSNFA